MTLSIQKYTKSCGGEVFLLRRGETTLVKIYDFLMATGLRGHMDRKKESRTKEVVISITCTTGKVNLEGEVKKGQ